MLITLLSAGLLMGAYFLLLYAGVGLIQDKRFFASAPRENLDAIPDRKPQRFPGAHALGWALGVLALLLFAGAFVLGGWDGVRRGFGFGALFGRFLFMLYAMEIYDILFFDWVLLCHSNFFVRFYPELRGGDGAPPVWLQQGGASAAFYLLPSPERRPGLGLHPVLTEKKKALSRSGTGLFRKDAV